jgi:hypothetical protein
MNTIDTNSIVLTQDSGEQTSNTVANPVDLNSITFGKSENTQSNPVIEQASKVLGINAASNLVSRVVSDFKNVDYHFTEDKYRPQLVNSISNATGIPTQEIDKYYSPLRLLFDSAVSGPAVAITKDVSPSTIEGIVKATMTPAIMVSAAIDFPGTAAGLVAYTALDHIIPTPQIQGATKDEQASINLMGMIAKGAFLGGLFHGATKVQSEWFPDVLEKFGFKKLKENGLPDVVEVKPEQLIKLKGEQPKEPTPAVTPQQKDFTEPLGLKPDTVENAIANNSSVKVPIEKLINIGTKSEEDFNHVAGILSGKQALEPVQGTGEVKTSKLAQGVEAKAIENKLTKGFSDLPEYRAVNMEEQAALAGKLLNKDPELARKIAMGDEPAPKDIIPEAVFVAVENKAIAEGDANTLRDLATGSKLSTEATAMGQRIATLATRDPESPTGAIKDILAAREERAQKSLGRKSLQKAKTDVAKEIKTELKKPRITKQDWESFIKSLEC